MKKLLLICISVAALAFENSLAQTGSWKLAGNSLAGTEKFGSKNGKRADHSLPGITGRPYHREQRPS